MSTATVEQSTKVVTGKVRLSYANVWKAVAMKEGDLAKFSTAILIPKEDTATVEKIRAAIQAAKQVGKAKVSDKKGNILPDEKLDICLRDGDDKDDENYHGHWFMNAKSSTKPGIVSREKDENGKFKAITDEEEVYSGCYCKVSINLFAFEHAGKKGIAAGLNNIIKIADGPALAGKASADADFADEVEEEEDF